MALSDLLSSSRAGYWGGPPGVEEVDVHVVRNGDIKPGVGVLWSELPRRSMNKEQVQQSRLQVGDVLITTSGECGTTAFVDREPEQVTCSSNFVRVLRADAGLVDPRYLFHYSRTSAFREALRPHIRGTALQNLSTRDAFAAAEVPLPTLDVQRRIAAILDQADALRAKRRRRALDLLEALPQAVFLGMFGSTTSRVCSVEEVALAKRGAIRTGPFGSQLLHSEFVPEGVAVLGLDNVVRNQFRWEQRRYITEQKYEQLKRYTVVSGDVLISIMGTCGRCVVVPDDIPTAINTKHICAVTVDRTQVFPEYLRACFLWHPDSRRYLAQRAKGSIMDGLNMSIIKEMPLPVAPLDQQREFVGRLRNAELGHELAVRSYECTEHLIRALQQRAFTGTTRRLPPAASSSAACRP